MKAVSLISLNLDWIYDKTIGRVMTWLTKTLGEALNVLAEALGSVLRKVLNFVVSDLWTAILEFVFGRIYLDYSAVLMILECIESGFRVMCGLDPITVKGQGQMSLLNAVYSQPAVRNMVAAMIGIGMALCFLFAILATVRSMFELGSRENNKPVTHVLRMTFKAFIIYITIPLVSMAMLALSGAILKGINRAITGTDQKTSMARIIYCISSLDAIDPTVAGAGSEKYNSSYQGAVAPDFGIMDKYRKPYYDVVPNEGLPKYMNIIEVKKTFALRKFDFVIGMVGAIYFTVIMCMVLFVFITRIFDVVILLIVEPIFVAPMPLDDGAHFRKWMSTFLGKLFGGYGSIVAMQIYLIILEQIFTNNISFTARDSMGARLQDYLICLIFAAGGGYAVQHMGPLITGLLNEGAARSEQEAAMAGLMVGTTIAKGETKALGASFKSTASAIGTAAGYGGTKAFNGIASLFGRGGSKAPNGVSSGNKFGGTRPAGGAMTGAAGLMGGGSSGSAGKGGLSGSSGPGIAGKSGSGGSTSLTAEQRKQGMENLFGKGYEQHVKNAQGGANKGGSVGAKKEPVKLNDGDLKGFGDSDIKLTDEQRKQGLENLFGKGYEQHMRGNSGGKNKNGSFSEGFKDPGSTNKNNSGGGNNKGGFNNNDLEGFGGSGSGNNNSGGGHSGSGGSGGFNNEDLNGFNGSGGNNNSGGGNNGSGNRNSGGKNGSFNNSDLNGFGNSGGSGNNNGPVLNGERRRQGFENLFGVNYDQYNKGPGGNNNNGGFSDGFKDPGSGNNNSGGGSNNNSGGGHNNNGGFNNNDLEGFGNNGGSNNNSGGGHNNNGGFNNNDLEGFGNSGSGNRNNSGGGSNNNGGFNNNDLEGFGNSGSGNRNNSGGGSNNNGGFNNNDLEGFGNNGGGNNNSGGGHNNNGGFNNNDLEGFGNNGGGNNNSGSGSNNNGGFRQDDLNGFNNGDKPPKK